MDARVRDADHDMASIGKLHFRSCEDDNGFSEEILPMHVVGGVGWMAALLREDPPAYGAAAELAADSGAGSSSYTDYDLAITTAATDWISARRDAERPWAAFVSLVSPHFPLTAPQQFYDLYADADFDLEPRPLPDHPEIRNLARFFDYERYFTADTRRAAMAGYFGLTSFLDDCVGRVLTALDDSGQADDTVVVYLSDHGELLGDKGLWTKQVMYESSAGIPLISGRPGRATGRGVQHCHLDCGCRCDGAGCDAGHAKRQRTGRQRPGPFAAAACAEPRQCRPYCALRIS